MIIFIFWRHHVWTIVQHKTLYFRWRLKKRKQINVPIVNLLSFYNEYFSLTLSLILWCCADGIKMSPVKIYIVIEFNSVGGNVQSEVDCRRTLYLTVQFNRSIPIYQYSYTYGQAKAYIPRVQLEKWYKFSKVSIIFWQLSLGPCCTRYIRNNLQYFGIGC